MRLKWAAQFLQLFDIEKKRFFWKHVSPVRLVLLRDKHEIHTFWEDY